MNTDSQPPESDRNRFLDIVLLWASRARYLAVSGLVHMILVIVLSGTILFKHFSEPPDFVATQEGLFTDTASLPDVPEPAQSQSPNLPSTFASSTTDLASAAAATPMASITTTATTSTNFKMASVYTPNVSVNTKDIVQNSAPAPTITGVSLSKGQAARIAAFTGRWSKGGASAMGQPLKSRAFEFTAYLAKYAGGDWDSTVWMDGDVVRGGSLHNLLFIISKLSHQKIHAQPQPVPLDLASNEIFEKKPPFIWFTGHRDFVLTDKEVENLGDYLRSGGCIWGDSSLPGRRSRFDIAFRREMLRLLPELSQKWEPIPDDHPIYASTYYPEIKGVAPGMNFYKEPIYGLKGFANELAVIYTANDYGDMWQFGIDEKGEEFDLSRDDKRRFVAINEPMWHRRNLYFRNVEPKSLLNTYKFGTNIIVHLLTRWEAHTRFVQTSALNKN